MLDHLVNIRDYRMILADILKQRDKRYCIAMTCSSIQLSTKVNTLRTRVAYISRTTRRISIHLFWFFQKAFWKRTYLWQHQSCSLFRKHSNNIPEYKSRILSEKKTMFPFSFHICNLSADIKECRKDWSH